MMPEFKVVRPASIALATRVLAEEPDAVAFAGGTDLVPNLRRGLGRPTLLVDLSAIRELGVFESVGDGGLAIGAGVRLARLAADAVVARHYPALAQAARAVAAPALRNAATLGGNLCLDTRCLFYNQSAWWRAANDGCLKHGGEVCHVAPQGKHCHAAFSGDLAAALLALDARAMVVGPAGDRWIELAQLYVDDGAAHLALARGELVAAIWLPPPRGLRSAYRKARVRGAIDFPLAGVAVALGCDDGVLRELRVAVTGTNSRPFIVEGTGALLDVPVTDAGAAELARLVKHQVRPMRTAAIGSNWRREVAAVYATRLLRELTTAGTPRPRM